ncbi:MAG: hypothetical protein Q9167_007833, partial [Letrouitia subvulpina]
MIKTGRMQMAEEEEENPMRRSLREDDIADVSQTLLPEPEDSHKASTSHNFSMIERTIVTADSDRQERRSKQDNLSPGSDGARVRVRDEDEGAKGE